MESCWSAGLRISDLVERTARVSRAGPGRGDHLTVVVALEAVVKVLQLVSQRFLINFIIFPLILSVNIMSNLPLAH